jgi:hypothetical protein
MRKLIAITSFVLMALSLAACSGSNSASISQESAKVEVGSDCAPTDASKVLDVVTKQVSALKDQDMELAYTFATKAFSDVVDVKTFYNILLSSYTSLLINESVEYGLCTVADQGFNQIVMIKSKSKLERMDFGVLNEDGRYGVNKVEIFSTQAIAG